MLLRYINAEGRQVEVDLGPKTLLIGRASDADIVLADEKISRLHCEIRPWDEDHVLKDLHSRNGTYVNDQRVDVAQLKAGDTIRVGSTVLAVERKPEKGTRTILREIDKEMGEKGKGYETVLREIVQSAAPAVPPRRRRKAPPA